MEIRRAHAGDVEGLAAQMKAVVDEGRWLRTESDRTEEELAEMWRSGLEKGHIIYVLERGDRIVGEINIDPTEIQGVHALGMCILAEFRGQGWGRRMVEAALDEAQAREIRKVELEVFPDNGRAIALYVSLGFEVEGIRRDHYARLDGSVRSAVLMARLLSNEG
jgi:ribosomal protein S18 acetylase RimI-like enzyme